MKCNVGKTDRLLRMIGAIVIAMAGIYFKSWWGLIAAIPMITSYTGYCPLYRLLGITTAKPVVPKLGEK